MSTKPAWDFVPHHDQERPRAPITLPLFWLLTVLWLAFRQLTRWTDRARRYVAFTMYDAPCPRCGASMWRATEGCKCLLTSPVNCTVNVPPDSHLQRRYDGGDAMLWVKLHTRAELFHWGRLHDFFADCALDSLKNDDRRAKLGIEPPHRVTHVRPPPPEDPFSLN